MICLIALVVFAILSIFSVKYRSFFWEALDCVSRKATLRKCNTSFDKKMRMKISKKVSKHSKKLGSCTYKHFNKISWFLTIVMIVSIIISGFYGFTALYDYALYGNCGGPNAPADSCSIKNIEEGICNLPVPFIFSNNKISIINVTDVN